MGAGTYDGLPEREQAVIRARWDRRIAHRRGELDLESEFIAAGESWSESDDAGNLTIRGANS
ncbi:hypothetical protein D2E42_24570 [Mycobacteroides abscessus]|uniref:hypothetical protein n=1 Tax=Mycobacteroides abscessus TaxID=36809 RepID=UPI000927F4F6|nr:hypothetical protein [Mycobacteroides abscessus]PVB46860.1 hypothetical protein DDK10_24210 [Mycobacteroides abscessus]RIR66342.1 hypothetical protein D2E42_24570 [Mycobacteroides abscessus]SIC94631.1 Uncharacterised protein [Mycobacteroides abscessus subsp. bolletii]SKT78091.1 Uncharacterised protein [Mycobacteroides abscessus subsp. bolletii]SLF81155.1 Uncharacterised protein [Mycobacteroides abscessus subsp. bolletii]